jgi:transketolase
MVNSNRDTDCRIFAKRIRTHALHMTHLAQASHIGTSLSIADILSVLYQDILRVNPIKPDWPERDRLILSKGHGCAALYATLSIKGFFPDEWLEKYCQNGAHLAGHITHRGVPGVEISTGSLGHGLPIGCGISLAGKYDKSSYRTFVLMSDGECDEGSTWEAALFAPQHKLDNLIVVLDYNKIQSMGPIKEILNLEPLAGKWQTFGWSVKEVNGHNYGQIRDALSIIPFEKNKPSCLIAHTIKGKGVSFMENQVAWHYKSPDDKQLQKALEDLES